ncbi:hypothetical protein LZ24_00129 [Desulfobotulus alkaliphilus]|uniref:Cohesin domain-containing protein n=1 Tax=Desulfobotulus alkaliphilus TaxID=622671 RepID=A0A562S7D2_9BACT|nr:cohesin domain-containing protein [Desulfobotulus alkaliphilus]TWI77325.1 hypothetical protein LZ24_00129 [Desulfobotulus alkaliphilus]
MRYLIFVFIFFLGTPIYSHGNDLFTTPFHGLSGGTADTRILIKDAPNDLENFSFVLSYDPYILSYDRFIESPGPGWEITTEKLTDSGLNHRIRVTFKTGNRERILEKDQDYLLAMLRFSVKKNQSSTIQISEPEGDIRNWRTAGSRFFHTSQHSSDEDPDTTAHITCFINVLSSPLNRSSQTPFFGL